MFKNKYHQSLGRSGRHIHASVPLSIKSSILLPNSEWVEKIFYCLNKTYCKKVLGLLLLLFIYSKVGWIVPSTKVHYQRICTNSHMGQENVCSTHMCEYCRWHFSWISWLQIVLPVELIFCTNKNGEFQHLNNGHLICMDQWI